MKGTVKFYKSKEGYGFITAEDGTEYFVHVSGVGEDQRITKDDEVEFEVEEAERGPKAVSVTKIRSARSSDE